MEHTFPYAFFAALFIPSIADTNVPL